MRLCVIPARGGSQRIPKKNIRPFAGRPMLAWPVATALASGLFERVVVSTDDESIAQIARDCGAEVPFIRPADLSDAHTGTNAVVRHAIEWHQTHGQTVEYACCLYATAPLVRAADLSAAFDRLQVSGKSFVFSVTRFDFPIQRALRLGSTGEVEAIYPQYRNARSQDLEPAWHDAGQFYWGTAQAFLRDTVLYSSDSLGYPLPTHRVQDIDCEDDWLRAELLFEILRQQGELQ